MYLLAAQSQKLNHYFFQLYFEHLFVIMISKEMILWQTYAPWSPTLTSARIIAANHRHAMVARRSADFIKKLSRRSNQKRRGGLNGLNSILNRNRAMEMEEPPPREKVAYLYNVLQTVL